MTKFKFTDIPVKPRMTWTELNTKKTMVWRDIPQIVWRELTVDTDTRDNTIQMALSKLVGCVSVALAKGLSPREQGAIARALWALALALDPSKFEGYVGDEGTED